MVQLKPVDHDPFQVEQVLAIPEIKAALKKPFVVNNHYCVPYGAGRSSDDRETYVDQHIPQYDRRFRLKTGGLGNLWKYVDAHEKTEFAAMTLLGMPYKEAHYKIATPIERHLVESDGGDWDHYEAVWRGLLDETEHEHVKGVPPNLYLGPYSHAEARKMELGGDKAPKPTLQPVEHDPFSAMQRII